MFVLIYAYFHIFFSFYCNVILATIKKEEK